MPSKESLIAKAKENLSTVLSALHANPGSRAHYLPLAQQVITQVNQSQIMASSQRLPERTWFLQGLQQYATWDSGQGSFQEIAAWCETQWNGILQQYPQNSAALNGAYSPLITPDADHPLVAMHRADLFCSTGQLLAPSGPAPPDKDL